MILFNDVKNKTKQTYCRFFNKFETAYQILNLENSYLLS